MMNVEINDVRIASLVKEAIDSKVVDMKSSLLVKVASNNTVDDVSNMDMTAITELVTDINALNEVSNQISVKIQFSTSTTTE